MSATPVRFAKVITLSCLCLASFAEGGSAPEILSRGPHDQRVQYVAQEPDEAGNIVPVVHSYIQVQTGLNRWDPSAPSSTAQPGAWVPASRNVQITPEGAGVVLGGQHQVKLPGNASSEAIDLEMPDGNRMVIQTIGLALTDPDTGLSVFLGEVQNCPGELVDDHTVIYRNAFDNIKASIQVKSELYGIESDVILEERITPEMVQGLGMNTNTTQLEVWHQVLNNPTATKKTDFLQRASGRRDSDDTVNLGKMSIPRGNAFSMGGPERQLSEGADDRAVIAVAKEWVRIEDANFLIEKIPFCEAVTQLQALPEPPQARLMRRAQKARAVAQQGDSQQVKRVKPFSFATDTKRAKGEMLLAHSRSPRPARGFIIDYQVLNTTQTDYVFRGDSTYFVSGVVALYGNTILEPGCVVKSDIYNNLSPVIKIYGSFDCRTGPYKQAIFTCKDDNSAGENISGSTGWPSGNGFYAWYNLLFMNSGNNIDVHDIKSRFTHNGLGFQGSGVNTAWNVQMFNCDKGFEASSANLSVRNALLEKTHYAFSAAVSVGKTITAEHVTIHTGGQIFYAFYTGNALKITNSIIVGVTNGLGAATISSNYVYGSSSDSGVFQTVKNGAHYLASDSPYRNSGTSSVTQSMLDILKVTTTFPPTITSGNVNADTTWYPVAAADSDIPDLGYHYPCLDYVLSGLMVNSAKLTLAPGVKVALYGANAISLRGSSPGLISKGRPDNLNWLLPVQASQDKTNILATPIGFVDLSYWPTTPVIDLGFTGASTLGWLGAQRTFVYSLGAVNPAPLSFSDCQFSSIFQEFPKNTYSSGTYSLINNVFERSTVSFTQAFGGSFIPVISVYNNLFYNTTNIVGTPQSPMNWVFNDNVFASESLTLSGSAPPADYNAYKSGLTPLGGTQNKTLSALDFKSGPFGNYYYPSTGGNLSTLVDAGSRYADVAGLYHFGVLEAQSEELNSKVDIGFHYAACQKVRFIGTDTSTQGSWKGRYGLEGYDIFQDASSYPSYASVTTSQLHAGTWVANGTEARYLERVENANRIAAYWVNDYGTTSVCYLNLHLTGTGPHRISIYCLDEYSSASRKQQIDIMTADGSQVLDSRTVNSFSQGQYWTWDVYGDVKIRFTAVGALNQSVISALFFDHADLTLRDTDGDGLADIDEDSNQDGLHSTAETSLALSDTDNDGRTDLQEMNDLTDPLDASSALQVRLGYWRFNTPDWRGEAGEAPDICFGVVSETSFSGTAAKFSTAPVVLRYNAYEPNGKANINRKVGTIRFYYKPSWSSSPGPQGTATLINCGDPAIASWWRLYLNANSQICFNSTAGAQSRTHFTTSPGWTANTWYQLALTYDSTGVSLYRNGVLIASDNVGPWAYSEPDPINIGSNATGGDVAKGSIDELETFNYPLTAADILNDWNDQDGDGLNAGEEILLGTDPRSWDSNRNGIGDGAEDPDADGWTNLEESQNGTDPSTFSAPKAPVFLTARATVGSGDVLVSWDPAPGTVSSYIVELKDWWMSDFEPLATTAGTVTSYVDVGRFSPVESLLQGTYYDGIDMPVYRVHASYTGNPNSMQAESEATAGSISFEPAARLARGENGRWVLVFSGLPTEASSVRLIWAGWDYATEASQPYNEITLIPVSQIQNGLYSIPDATALNHLTDDLYVQVVDVSGAASQAVEVGRLTGDAPCFMDGRVHLKQSLIFRMRQAAINSIVEPQNSDGLPVDYGVPEGPWLLSGPNFVEAGLFYRATMQFFGSGPCDDLWRSYVALDDLLPFNAHYFLGNYLFDAQIDPFAWDGTLNSPPAAAVLGQPDPVWILQDINHASSFGITGSATMGAGLNNFFGLSFTTAQIEDSLTGWYPLNPGSSIAINLADLASQTTRPQLQWIDYYFAPIITPGTHLPGGCGVTAEEQPYPSPIKSGFSLQNVSPPFLVASVGHPMVMGGWSRWSVQNGYAGRFGALGQYFDHAYRIDGNGNVTATQTGILSPYGEFLPTEPGPTALRTLADLDTGLQGTVSMHVISIAVDQNRDGVVDLNFTGPDQATLEHPFVFWLNDDYDRGHTVDSTDWEEDDRVPGVEGFSVFENRDYSYFAGGVRAIPCKRDLEDYAPIRLGGISETIAHLPAGYTVTLSWRNPGGVAIDVFRAVDPAGGTAYLTSTPVADQQIGANGVYIGSVSLSQTIDLTQKFTQYANDASKALTDNFIFCGSGIGSGELVLRVKDSSGAVLAESSAFIEIKNIKDFYERYTVGEVGDTGTSILITPLTAWRAEYTLPAAVLDRERDYILFVHGWNLNPVDKLRFAETAFTRLYWQGYNGRFGFFKWPTYFLPADASKYDVALDAQNFDRSEFNAWKSAAPFLNLLTSLQAKYPGRVRLFAHSLGGVTAAEALRRAAGTVLVHTFVSTQAALAAHAFDPNPAFNVALGVWDSGTPNCYAAYWTTGSSQYFFGIQGASRFINYFNPVDWALTADIWERDQKVKPDNGYAYDPVSGFLRAGLAAVPLNFPGDTYEIFSFADEARSHALGVQANVGGPFTVSAQVDLNSRFSFGSAHKGHSAEFRSHNALRGPYWDQLLRTFLLKGPQ